MISEKILPKPEKRPGPAIIVDIGSHVKAGVSSEMNVLVNEQSIVATYPPELDTYASIRGPFVGENALKESSKSPSLNFSFPIECGLPVLMQDAEIVLKYIIKQTRYSAELSDVILTKKSLTPKKFLRDLCKSMFETFKVHRLSFVNSDLASLNLTGRTTGVVVDMGSSQIMITPVIDGMPQMHAIRRLELGGRDITEYLQRQLEESSGGLLKFRSAAEVDIVRQLKEKSCVVAKDWHNPSSLREALDANEKVYELPDGSEIRIGFPRMRAPEILFHPGLSGSKLEEGLHQKIFSCVSACDMTCRRTLYNNILVIGGPSETEGLVSRLQQEVSSLVPKEVSVKVFGPQDRGNFPFKAAHTSHQIGNMKWITQEMYENMDLNELPI
jgi:actin-related protein